MSEPVIAGPLDVLLRVGDKLRLFGGWWIVDMVNESRARCRSLSTKHVKMNVAATGETVEFDKRGATYTSIANKVSLCAGETVERTGRAGLESFLAGQHPAPAGSQQQGQNNEQQTKGQDSMNNSKARGGLAADAAADKKSSTKGKGGKGKNTENGSKGSLGELFGNSVTSVLRSLGKAGVTTAHAREIMKAQKIKVADATVQIQVNAGKNGKTAGKKGKEVTYASITQAQVKELKDSAEEPKPEPKAEAAAAAA